MKIKLYNKKTLVLSVFLFLFLENVYVQSEIEFNFDTVLNTSILKKSNEIDFIKIDQKMYFYRLSNSTKIVFYDLNLRDSICVLLPKKNISTKFEFDYFENTLVLTCYKNHLIFKRNKNEFSLIKEMQNNFRNSKILKNNKILFYNNYNFNPQDCPIKDRSKLAVFDIAKDSIINQVIINFNYIFYTHLVSNFIDVNMLRNLIVIAQTLPYKISIYNENLQLIRTINDTIVNDIERISKLDSLSSLSNKYLNTKMLIREVSLNDKNINRIQKVYFSSDSILFVIKKMSSFDKNKKNRYIDVINLSNKKHDFLIKNQQYSSSIFYVEDNKVFPTVPFTNSGRFIFYENYIFFMKEYVPLNKISKMEDLMRLRQSADFDKSTYGLYKFSYEIK